MRSRVAMLTAVVMASSIATPHDHAAAAPSTQCRDHSVRVALEAGAPRQHLVRGTLCVPGPPRKQPTVHLLLSGASYGRIYWDFPYRPATYSYVRALNGSGYATFNIDRIGLGRSSRPPPESVTIESNAFVVHQLVRELKQGHVGGLRFGRVVLVAHSLGVGIAWVEAARYRDVDGLILADGMHTPSPGLGVAIASFYPARFDQRFRSDLPAGYVTTLPGRRGPLFYYEPGAEPRVIELDEATKETATDMELATLALSADSSNSQSIDVPVLSVMGEFDRNFCDIPCSDPMSPAPAMEPSYYGSKACLEIFIVPNAGHDTNLHRSAPVWYRKAVDWSNRRIGRSGAEPGRSCR